MIYKLTFDDGRIEWCTAKSQLHLLKSYDYENDMSLQEIEDLEEISDDDAKTIMINNTEFDEIDPDEPETVSLSDLAINDDFRIIASNQWE